jgi:hypothetical protein
MIDLDEFERRLRRPAAAAPQPQEDPLAELARLVGGHEDPFKTVFEHDRHAPRPARDARAPVIPAPAPARPRTEPHFDENFAAENFTAEEFVEETPQFHGTIDPQIYANEASPMTAQPGYHDQARAEEQDYAWSGVEQPIAASRLAPEAPRSRRPLFVMAAIIAVGITGIGASFAYKSKSGPHELATIQAMAGPTKIQPDSPGGMDVPNQDASILNKNPQQIPAKLADHRELPVDLSAQPSTPPRVVMADAGSTTGIPSQSAINSAPQDIQSYGIGALIEPKKVKTVSVRSDGTLLPNDTPPQMPQSAPSAMQAPPATPSAAATTTPKPATAKSTARVVTTPKPPQSIDQLAANAPVTPPAPVPAKPKTVPAKPVKLAEAETADTAQDAAAPGGAGGFAVQFAAPGSEQEAHEMTAKLAQKFGDDLSGHHLTYHRAKVGDKTVYRVRTAGLSREEATGICEKVKADGGSCFIAKN